MTPTGKRLWELQDDAAGEVYDTNAWWSDTILAIEAEAARQERERLRADHDMLGLGYGYQEWHHETWRNYIRSLLAEPEETP